MEPQTVLLPVRPDDKVFLCLANGYVVRESSLEEARSVREFCKFEELFCPEFLDNDMSDMQYITTSNSVMLVVTSGRQMKRKALHDRREYFKTLNGSQPAPATSGELEALEEPKYLC